MDASSLGQFVAAFMERIEDEFGDGASVRTHVMVVEVDTGDATTLLAASSDDRPWVQLALLAEGQYAIEDRLREAQQEDDG